MEGLHAKISTREEITRKINQWRLLGYSIAFTNGCFDVLHSGHLKVLSVSNAAADKLIVGLNTDSSVKILKGNSRPIKNENERALCLASMYLVDAVCLFEEETPADLIRLIQPDILIKGGDYTEDNIVGADLVKKKGGKIIIVPTLEGKSSSSLIDKMNQ